MMQNWVNTYYPGTKTGITEYNFGADDNMNGATTQADVRHLRPARARPGHALGRLRHRHADLPGDAALAKLRRHTIRLRQHQRRPLGANPDQTDAFSAIRSSDGAMTVAVINKNLYNPSNPSATTTITVNLSGFAEQRRVRGDGSSPPSTRSDQTTRAITHLSDIHFTATASRSTCRWKA